MLLVLVLAAFAWLGAAQAQDVLPVPALTARVIDQTNTLDAIQRQGLEDRLAQLERTRGAQVVVLLVPTTQPEDIASYANRVANTWKIGRRDVGDGVLLIVAKDDRRVRIEVAKTLEGAIPDLAARQIIETAITPSFRAGNYALGLQQAADQIAARIAGEALPAPAQPDAGGPAQAGFDWFDLAIFLFFAVPVAGAVLRGIFGRKLGALITGGGVGAIAMLLTASVVVAAIAGVLALAFTLVSGGLAGVQRRRGYGGVAGGPWISTGGWGGGGGWSGGGGGGFGSGGGGDFGGGGASGDW